ncbi:MAG: DMT family transporter [Deltaproteobacteria bacterium]|nr:DMT family transporter [Deltaproteobacteria bacterium]
MEKNDSYCIAGYALAATSAVTFSIKGIFAKILYSYGLDPVTLLALRFMIAMPLFWAALMYFPSERVSLRDFITLVLSGVIGFYAAALADFYGLLYIDASIERIILYTYPALVVVLTAVFFKERLGKRKIISIALTYAGLALALNVFSGGLRADMTGAALILLSALVYSVSYLITEVLSARVSGVKISAYSTTAAAFAFIGTWRFSYVPREPLVWAYLVLIASISTFVPVLTLALGIKRIGASRAAVVSLIGPVSTAILAYLILGERLNIMQGAGMCLVIGGVLIISMAKGSSLKSDGRGLKDGQGGGIAQ